MVRHVLTGLRQPAGPMTGRPTVRTQQKLPAAGNAILTCTPLIFFGQSGLCRLIRFDNNQLALFQCLQKLVNVCFEAVRRVDYAGSQLGKKLGPRR